MARVMIIGSGVVGQATGKGLIKKGHKVVFVDTNTETISRIRQEGFEARSPDDLEDITAELSMLCVPTPTNSDDGVNLEHLRAAVTDHGKWLKYKNDAAWHLLVVRSTILPGTTRGILIPLFEECAGLTAGKDFGVCVQPEFLRAKSSEEDFLSPWAIVVGELDQRSGDILTNLYADFGSPIYRIDIEGAEFLKCVHNCFNATKISFTNEMWLLGRKLGIDTNSIMKIVMRTAEASWNSDYGTIGGQPYGGDCLPKDSAALLRFAQKLGTDLPLLSAVISVNQEMADLAKQNLVSHATCDGPMWKPSPNISGEKDANKEPKWHRETQKKLVYQTKR